jgi:predicted dehydrogenase
VSAVAEAGVATIVDLTLRFTQRTRDWLSDLSSIGGWTGGFARWYSTTLVEGDFARSPWRHAGGAIVDIGPHCIDLLDAALGPVTGIREASFSEPDRWHVVLHHEGGATSTMSLSMKAQRTMTEVEVFGNGIRRSLFEGDGNSASRVRELAKRVPGLRPLLHQLRGTNQAQAITSYMTMLDEFRSMVSRCATAHSCDVGRGLHLQRILEQARLAAIGQQSPRS